MRKVNSKLGKTVLIQVLAHIKGKPCAWVNYATRKFDGTTVFGKPEKLKKKKLNLLEAQGVGKPGALCVAVLMLMILVGIRLGAILLDEVGRCADF